MMEPKGNPGFGFEDLIEGNIMPIQESLIGPTSSYFLDSVTNLSEGRFNGIHIERDEFSFMEPPSKESGDRVNEVLNVGASLWILLGVQGLQQFLETLLSLSDEGFDSRTIIGTKWFQLAFREMHPGNRV